MLLRKIDMYNYTAVLRGRPILLNSTALHWNLFVYLTVQDTHFSLIPSKHTKTLSGYGSILSLQSWSTIWVFLLYIQHKLFTRCLFLFGFFFFNFFIVFLVVRTLSKVEWCPVWGISFRGKSTKTYIPKGAHFYYNPDFNQLTKQSAFFGCESSVWHWNPFSGMDDWNYPVQPFQFFPGPISCIIVSCTNASCTKDSCIKAVCSKAPCTKDSCTKGFFTTGFCTKAC